MDLEVAVRPNQADLRMEGRSKGACIGLGVRVEGMLGLGKWGNGDWRVEWNG